MLSKSKHLYSLSRWWVCLPIDIYSQDYRNYITGVTNVFQNAFSSVAEPTKANDTSTDEKQSPELPGWVKLSVKDKMAKKLKNDDFVPPSLSYWIENHKSRVQDVDMKTIVNNIVESDVDKISKILKRHFKSPDSVIKALHGCDVDLSNGLVEQILRRFSHEWIPSFGFFKWAESQKGINHSPDLYNLMVDNLGKTRKFEIMWELVEKMKKLEGYVTLETMTKIMRRLAKAGKYDDAIEAFEIMNLFGVVKDITSMNILLDSLVKQGSVEHAERAYLKLKEHILPTKQTFNVLVHGWCKIRQIDKAKKTVDEMKACGCSPDAVTYTSFIEAYCREKDFRKANSTLEEMEKDGISPGVVVYTIMMNAYAKAKEINKSIEVYEQMKKNNCAPDASFYNVFISALSRAGRLKDADEVFEDMSRQGVAPDVSTYNTLIFIAAIHLEEEKALSLLMKMEENNNCKPNIDTYAPLLKMCCRLNRMKVLSFLLSHMFGNDVSLDPGTYSLLVSRLCGSGNVVRACSFFEEMVEKGFVPMDCTYEILIKELEKKGMDEEKRRIEEVMLQAKQPQFG
ncbi:pentatricopeptide repeat-containing protein at3g22670 mitochondrial [Phtheirospermum japonicum]|uniref:Pentatricopeptide repeat-containing protein at3g22670 mitochondrial n=1 Tax=Phtheirospermum japonicum TaxID=374723 RepID=A0A830BK26_9LAMI|nr:pentatricopeptide repeat-containing protein at3g22670 mitochondrial [Phtheirospermum japonicum]